MKRLASILAACGIAFALGASSASAAETRAEYVSQVDPICKATQKPLSKAAKPLLKAVSALNKAFRDPNISEAGVEKAAQRFTNISTRALGRINKIFGRMLAKIAIVAPAPGDEQVVSQWIAEMRRYKRLNEASIRALRKGKTFQGLNLSLKALDAAIAADELVADFGFKHCAF